MGINVFSLQVVKMVLFTFIHLFLAHVFYVLLDALKLFIAVIYFQMPTCKLAGAICSYLQVQSDWRSFCWIDALGCVLSSFS